jgi:hypothetical protein
MMRARKEFPKDSAWHSPKGPFREALKRRALAIPFPGLTEKKKRQFEVNRASGIQALCARNASR